MVVSSKTDLRFPESGQQGHGARIIHMALILRNGGSQSPDRWLKEPRNNQVRPEERGNLNI